MLLTLNRDDAEDHPDGAALLEHVATEAPQARHAIGEVDFLRVLELLALGGRHDGRRHLHEVLVVQPLLLRDARQPPVDAHHGVAADLQVKVGGALVDGNFSRSLTCMLRLIMKEKPDARKGAGLRRAPAVRRERLTGVSQWWASGTSPG